MAPKRPRAPAAPAVRRDGVVEEIRVVQTGHPQEGRQRKGLLKKPKREGRHDLQAASAAAEGSGARGGAVEV